MPLWRGEGTGAPNWCTGQATETRLSLTRACRHVYTSGQAYGLTQLRTCWSRVGSHEKNENHGKSQLQRWDRVCAQASNPTCPSTGQTLHLLFACCCCRQLYFCFPKGQSQPEQGCTPLGLTGKAKGSRAKQKLTGKAKGSG